MIRIVRIDLSPNGPDTLEKLNEECVVIRNDGARDVQMVGWRLLDQARHVYLFPARLADGSGWTLSPGEFAVVHTGSGRDRFLGPTPGFAGTFHLYWGNSWWIWNYKGDTAFLFDQAGQLIDSKSARSAA